MTALPRLFRALSFDFESGRLTAPDLRDRIHGITLSCLNDKKSPVPLGAADDRFPGNHLYDDVLNNDLLHDLLNAGFVDGAVVRQSVDWSTHLATGEELAWRTVWHAYDRPEDEVAAATTTIDL